MESIDSSTGLQQPNLPPGFRFHPTDEELVVQYLKKKASSIPLPVSIIADVDIYKFDPWELPAKATFGEQEWYFFSPRERKYPNGARPNRAATSGYWKATGTDKPVLSVSGTQKVGVKKALVFYGGKPPKGIKTNWIMHEYRLIENKVCNKPPGYDLGNKKNSSRLDDWVLCRIYKKNDKTMDHGKKGESDMDNMIRGMRNDSANYGLLRNDDGDQSLFQAIGLMDNNNNNHDHRSIMSQLSKPDVIMGNFVTHLPPPAPPPNLKRNLHSLVWTGENSQHVGVNGVSMSERYEFDNGDENNDHGINSIASLQSQFPQTSTQLHQPQVFGSLEDGIFRPPFQLSGLNWYP